jgi:hypothetical protein
MNATDARRARVSLPRVVERNEGGAVMVDIGGLSFVRFLRSE